MFSIFDCTTGERVSDKSYATLEEANHDYFMNQGHTRVGEIPNSLNCPSLSELKPCPFCGGEAISARIDGFSRVHCLKCDAEILRMEGKLQPNRFNEAVKDWNTRVTP